MKALVSRVMAVLALAGCVSVATAAAMDCNEIRTAYASALRQAQICDLAASDSCSATRPWAPQDVCRCQVAVNPARTEELDRLLAQFKSQACPFDRVICNRGCVSPTHKCTAVAGPSPTCDGA